MIKKELMYQSLASTATCVHVYRYPHLHRCTYLYEHGGGRGVFDAPTQSNWNMVGEDAGEDILQEPQGNLFCVLPQTLKAPY